MADRIQAIDVFRGITVAWMIVVNTSAVENGAYAPLLHARWHGLTLTDLVFPTFLFVVGLSLCFALDRLEQTEPTRVLRKIATRTVLLFLCGYLLEWAPFFCVDAAAHWTIVPISHTRILGVLQRIALCYGCAACIAHLWRSRGAAVFSIVTLLGYWWLLQAYGDYTPTGNAVLKLDRLVLGPAHMQHSAGVTFDEEGLLSTLPAIVNVLAGYLAARFLRGRGTGTGTIAMLILAGAACLLLAAGWNVWLPFNKKLWTSSYVLAAVGFDLASLAAIVYVVRLAPKLALNRFFEVFGRNALFVYILSELGNSLLNVLQPQRPGWLDTAAPGGISTWLSTKPGGLLVATVCMLLCWCVAYALDRKGLRIRL